MATQGEAPAPWRVWLEGMRSAAGREGRPTGLVLSGGGSRASFQLGALRYLYDVVGITPQVIAGTSAGAILGAMLAQAGDHEGQRAYLAELEDMWRGMRDSSQMFRELPWFSQLRERGPLWLETIERRERRQDALRERRQGALGRSFQKVAQLREDLTQRGEAPDSAAASAASSSTPTVASGSGAASTAAAGHTAGERGGDTAVDPVGETAGEDEERRSSEVSTWHPSKVLESLERLRILGRAGTEIVDILRGAQESRSMFEPGQRVEELLTTGAFEPARVVAAGVQLRIAIVALESGELRFVRQDGTLVDRDDVPVPGESAVDLGAAVRASCSIPMVLPPVRLGAETYVDGGVRESLPADIAQRVLGAAPCYAVLAGPTAGLPRESSYADKDMLAIMTRATTGIMADELQRDEAVVARRAGAVVIEPEFDVHETLTVTPGLTAIAMDYGYLRAAEACLGASEEQQRLGRSIIELRRRIWRVEEELFAPTEADATQAGTSPTAAMGAAAALEAITEQPHEPAEHAAPLPHEALIARLADHKRRLRDLVEQMPPAHLPPGAERWWATWEAHAFQIAAEPDWIEADETT